MDAQFKIDERELWEVENTYVIGHQRPDTDAIASALGYAWFLSETGAPRTVAARAGQLPPQTTFALRRFDYAAPPLLNGVAPLFAHITRSQKALPRDAPLSEAMAEMASGVPLVPVLDEEKKPLGVVTPMALARAYGTLGQDAQGLAKALAMPCGEVLEKVPTFSARQRISEQRRALLRLGADDFLVTDEAGEYVGVTSRADVLEPPRAHLILVDHNELGQAVSGADEAEIVAVLDHHRLGNSPTALPIPFVVEPVGSTCTLVGERCRREGLTVPPSLAGVLLSGILSDTLVFRSPTTTPRDRTIGEWLAKLSDVDLEAYGDELLRVTPGLMARDVADILDGDRKGYEMSGQKVSIGQVEVTNLLELPQRREELLEAMQERRDKENLALICLMVTDIVTGTSHLLCQAAPAVLGVLPFNRVEEGEWDLKRLVSRKKQLVPAISDVMESAL
ncbi:CBS domain-containing protein [bacterium]|nr:MAG: CBS domain-containing protein [bacterium]